MERIGFIGLGHMGRPMCLNLHRKGYEIIAFDVAKESLEAIAELGIRKGNNLTEIVTNADIVITMLPEGKHVRSVYLGEDGLLNQAQESVFFADCSTIDVETAKEISQKAIALGHKMVDGPVSGGVKGAENALLSFMVGGSREDFEFIRPFLQNMGKNIFHCGPNGTGQAAKICNNLMLAIHMIGTCEGFALAEKLGLEKKKLFEIASVSSGQSWSLTSYCPVPGPMPASPANFGYKAGFTAQMMLKDLKLAEAASSDVKLDLSQNALNLYEKFCNSGNANLDFSGIYLSISGAKKE